jgi:hypothetical protein
MSRSSCAFFLLAAATLLAASGSAHAQEKPDNVHFLTADGVKLKGQYYAAPQKCLATVIMLHPIGEGKSSKAIPEWQKLAESLQKANYSVLTFDFRGHGDSIEIAAPKDFWSKLPNSTNVKPKGKAVDEIDVKDYIKQGSSYLPVLVNDIAAARAYLDRRNDSIKDCNTSSIIVIGADNGATLGALWMNAEWNRYRAAYNPMLGRYVPETRAEGNDIIGAVFLSPTSLLDKRPVSLSTMLNIACKERATAAAFFVGKEDKKSWELAKALEKNLRVPKSKKHEYIGAVEFETNLTGLKLLTAKSLKTDEFITKYLADVVEERNNPWSDHEFDKSFYMWRQPNGMMVPARKKGDKTLLFDDYGKFISK